MHNLTTFFQTLGATFTSFKNTYCLAICDPAGGKSVTYDKVITPVLDANTETTGQTLNLETCKLAWIHKHQVDNEGYGVILSDEGHRFLSSIQTKEEMGMQRGPLYAECGVVEVITTLSSDTRGFKKTSISVYLPIQPQPLLTELLHFHGKDGFLDRFPFFVVKPKNLFVIANTRKP